MERLTERLENGVINVKYASQHETAIHRLVTIEDILELIVGEIEDEYDAGEEPEQIRRLSKSVFAVHGLTPIEEFNDFFDADFSDDEVDTVGGLVMHAFGHLPKKGEEVTLAGFSFKVLHADRRRLLQLQVRIPQTHEAEGEAPADD